MSEDADSGRDSLGELTARDTTFDNVIPERVWLCYDNGKHRGPYFKWFIEINGIRKEIESFYIPGIDQREGHHCGSHNLTWILAPLRSALEEERLVWQAHYGLQNEKINVAIKERDDLLKKYRAIELANKEMSRLDHVKFGELLQERDEARLVLQSHEGTIANLRAEIASLKTILSGRTYSHSDEGVNEELANARKVFYDSQSDVELYKELLSICEEALEGIAALGCYHCSDEAKEALAKIRSGRGE